MAHALDKPPQAGNFFYADFEAGDNVGPYGVKATGILLGDTRTRFGVSVSAKQQEFALVTTECSECNVPQKIEMSETVDAKQVSDIQINTMEYDTYRHNSRDLILQTHSGIELNSYIKMYFYRWHRETTIFINKFLGIETASQAYNSLQSGYLGFAPYTVNTDKRDSNIMHELNLSGKINHNVITFAISMNQGNSSTIKFGSWDEFMLESGKELHILKTNGLDTWNLGANKVKLGDKTIREREFQADIDPGVPYIYVPDNDYISIIEDLAQTYQNQGLICVFSDNYCMFKKSCGSVNTDNGKDLEVTLRDDASSIVMSINQHDLLVPGTAFSDSADTCYIGIFRSEIGHDNDIQLGTVMMQNYIVVYDMTPYDERNDNYIQVGIGPRDTQKNVGETRYQPTYSGYNPAVESQDQSHIISPYVN